MTFATRTHLAALRDRLACRRAELRAEVHTSQLTALPGEAPAWKDVTDRKDEAEQSAAQGISAAEAQRDLDELALVEAALRRMDENVYGDCADCGEPIPLERLSVQPAALRCTACQAAFEARVGSFAGSN
jgi:DnaK suppressor protein